MTRDWLDEATARAEICRVGRSLFQRGYVHATAGNISVRLADGFLITPTDACLGFLEAERLARLDSAGRHVGGDRASKTITLHRRIYEATAARRHRRSMKPRSTTCGRRLVRLGDLRCGKCRMTERTDPRVGAVDRIVQAGECNVA